MGREHVGCRLGLPMVSELRMRAIRESRLRLELAPEQYLQRLAGAFSRSTVVNGTSAITPNGKVLMNRLRWDETWHRLRDWTQGQAPSERLAAQILYHEGFTDLDPSHPLGGRDGGKDALALRNGKKYAMAVYFPRGEMSFREIKEKLEYDLKGAKANAVEGIAFVTNQEIRLAERELLRELDSSLEIETYHLERITAILDTPAMGSIRKQFLGIVDESPVTINLGGGGGNAPGAGGGGGGAIGPGAIGGLGGPGGLINLDGQAGQTPGAGGGGGGSAAGIQGRAADSRDLASGLRITTLLLANSVEIHNGLLYLMGAGWVDYSAVTLPCETVWPLVCTISLRDIEPTAIKFVAIVTDPSGQALQPHDFTVTVHTKARVNRVHNLILLPVTIDKIGLWSVAIKSGTYELAQLSVEVKGPGSKT